ncbi:MAG: hypothetical protein QXP97_05965 [Desulfurococcus sp.]|jgi:hypothetical protein|uniref:hypothetical protein n=1 Tax=Desulfurococcus sp. TaxID=51678 RepID=UPI0031667472
MHLNELASLIRTLVDDYEKLIDQGKILKSLYDKEQVDLFISEASKLLDSSARILPEAKLVVSTHSLEDVTVKHISVYYRMLKLISIRYIVDLLEEALPVYQGMPEVLSELQRLLAGFKKLEDTL